MALSEFVNIQPGAPQAPQEQVQPAARVEAAQIETEAPESLHDVIRGNARPTGAAATDDVELFGGITDWIEKSLGDYAAEQQQIGEMPNIPTQPEQPKSTVDISGKSDPLLGQGIEISTEIFVEILEAVVGSLATWYSGDETTNFDFDKKLKARYTKVAELYAKTQNVKVSPGFLFGAFTIVLIGQVGMKAHKRKTEIVKAQAFRKQLIARQHTPNSAGQLSLFGGIETQPEKRVLVNSDNSVQVPEAERQRVDWAVDQNGYYIKDSNGSYLKKGERNRRPSPELKAFIDEFYRVHLSFPNNKEVKQYLKTM